MAHLHMVSDSDSHFVVDTAKRTIKSKPKKSVMQYDHNSERFTFELDRYLDGHDMSICNVVEVHYNNGGNCGLYIVDDLRVNEENADKVLCSWLISRNATQKVAPLEFRLTFKCVSGSDTDYEWSTAVFRGVSVAPGIRNSETVEEAYPDVIAQMIARINDIGKGEVTVLGSSARVDYVKISADKWVGEDSPYSQVVHINDITENSQVDLTPSVEQLVIFHDKDLAFVAVNEDAVVTVYAIGQKPENDYTIQVTITEVLE